MRPSRARSWLRRALIWLGLLLGLYAAAMAYLTVTQESRIFFPRTLDAARADEVVRQVPDARRVRLEAPDGTPLHGWWRSAFPGAPSGRVLLYFGANAEDVHWRLGRVEAYAGWDLLLTDYRGYGRSGGIPGQEALQADALLWHDRLAAGLDGLPVPKAIAVMGTSLGSYYATHVAARRPVAGIVLVTPFDSVRDYIQSRMPLVPVGLILRHPMDSRALAGDVRAPSLFIAAENDITIPPARGRLLFDAWGGAPRDWVLVPQSNHETVSAEPLYWDTLARFLAGLP